MVTWSVGVEANAVVKRSGSTPAATNDWRAPGSRMGGKAERWMEMEEVEEGEEGMLEEVVAGDCGTEWVPVCCSWEPVVVEEGVLEAAEVPVMPSTRRRGGQASSSVGAAPPFPGVTIADSIESPCR
ncbi:hypothetical protein HDU96_011017 [Phlyctochytrium bullatum]|nr:hypothetical protein HDU96_011017 [Phlyctochytrium bullatum]